MRNNSSEQTTLAAGRTGYSTGVTRTETRTLNCPFGLWDSLLSLLCTGVQHWLALCHIILRRTPALAFLVSSLAKFATHRLAMGYRRGVLRVQNVFLFRPIPTESRVRSSIFVDCNLKCGRSDFVSRVCFRLNLARISVLFPELELRFVLYIF